jgi:hypothetical protein
MNHCLTLPRALSPRDFLLLAVLCALGWLAAAGCTSTTYGGKDVPVLIVLDPPSTLLSAAGWAPEGWVIDSTAWKAIDGKNSLPNLSRLRQEGEEEAADALLASLYTALEKDHVVKLKRAENEVRVPATTLYLVVLHDGRLPWKRFDAVTERKVALSL